MPEIFESEDEENFVGKPSPPHSKINMYYFYALQSEIDKDLYFGYTEDLRKRVKEHNNGRVPATRNRRPLECIYYEAYKSEKDARERERQIKRRAKAHISLKRRLQHSLKD